VGCIQADFAGWFRAFKSYPGLTSSATLSRPFGTEPLSSRRIANLFMANCGGDTIAALHPMELRALSAKPLVSILVSNYNYARYIGEAIESALSQTYSNIELIICDDGSTDNSVDIIEGYQRKDPRLQLIRKANGGQASGFNAAFSASRGELVALLDSDDCFLPHKVEKTVTDFQAHPDAGFGLHRVIRISADRRRQGVWPMSAPLPSGWYGSSLLRGGGILAYTPPTSGLSFHRDVAERMFPLPVGPILVSCPDQLITRLAPLLTSVTGEDEALSEYRLHGGNNYGPDRVSAASFKRELDYCAALWHAQKLFLAAIAPGLEQQLQPLEVNDHFAFATYLHARMSRDRDARQHYDRFIATLGKRDRFRWFWRLSIYLPLPIFDFAVNTLMRQSWLKQLVSRLKRMS
jgi:glycosyltransferase involved in cell wall biosynthesis